MTNATISWAPVTDGFGAVVDIALAAGLSDAVLAELGTLFNERQMLVFRNQDTDLETQRRLVSAVGTPFVNEVDFVSNQHGHKGDPLAEPADPDPRTVMFHSDLVFDQRLPVHGISLYAQDVDSASPRAQGTRFLSARNAYLKLSPAEVAELEGRTMISLHSLILSTEEQADLRNYPFEEIVEKITWSAQHPILYPNPRTGDRTLLYIPWFAHSISGMTSEESQAWFAKFDELLYQDESEIYTNRWERGDLVFWDNLAMQHCKQRLADDAPAGPLPTRTLRRVAFGSEEPNLY
jgi:alpha-ketoglutarate-dependent taurine dioxygenase